MSQQKMEYWLTKWIDYYNFWTIFGKEIVLINSSLSGQHVTTIFNTTQVHNWSLQKYSSFPEPARMCDVAPCKIRKRRNILSDKKLLTYFLLLLAIIHEVSSIINHLLQITRKHWNTGSIGMKHVNKQE